MPDPLRDWNQGDPLSHSHLQEPVSALRRLLSLPGAGVADIKVERNGWRFTISVGRIVDKGPNNEAAPTDARYWVQRCFLESEADLDDAITLSDELAGDDTVIGDNGTESVPTIFTVTNLPELANNTHGLPTGQFVWYFTLLDAQDDPTPHHFISEGGSGLQIVQVADPSSGKGKYTGVVVYPASDDISGADDIDSVTIFDASSPSIMICNLLEITTSQALKVNAYYLAKLWKTNSDGTPVYVTWGLDVEACPTGG